jgi:hypothetical protein
MNEFPWKVVLMNDVKSLVEFIILAAILIWLWKKIF